MIQADYGGTYMLACLFLIVALLIGLWFAVLLLDQGTSFPIVILTAAVVTTAVWLAFTIWTWRIWMCLSRGAPFRVGDRVEITDGPFKGELGEVRKVCEGRCSVWIALERGSVSCELYLYDWDQLRLSDRPARPGSGAPPSRPSHQQSEAQ
mgnify:CR=1 FL=1